MAENEVFEYSLNTGQEEEILKMKTADKNIIFSIESKDGSRYSALITFKQIKEVCQAFNTTKTLKELIMILHKTIESGNISLAEDKKDSTMELKFSIKSASGDYPQFGVVLQSEKNNSLKEEIENDELPPKFDYKGNVEVEKKYGQSKENTTEYNKPIVQPNIKKPILQLEYIEPILQVHYPDGTTKSQVLPARIQTVDGQIPNIDEEQFKLIQQEMNRHMANNTIEGTGTSKYSLKTVPDKKNKKKGKGKKSAEDKSKYSTFSVPAKPIVYPEQKYIKNASNPNNIIEYAPNMTNNSYTFAQSPIDYNKLINQNSNYNNYSNYQSSNSQYETKYQYQNNLYNSYNPNNSNQFDQAFAEVIPLNPIQEYLQSQSQTQPKNQIKKPVKKMQKYPKNQKASKNSKNQKTLKNPKNQKKIDKNPKDNETAGKKTTTAQNSQQQNSEEIEQLYRTEDGLIIFRNGILRGIINKYAEIDNVVSRIQDIILKGARFKLLYKATIHGDKASVFHEKCDNHQLTLVLIETNKGVRFGGFTTKTWDGHCLKKVDNNAFVFSIDENKIYDVILDVPAVGCYPKFGPVFFGCQIRIYNEFFTKGGSTCYSGLNYKTTKDFELNKGEQTYIVKDIEVYDIEPIDV